MAEHHSVAQFGIDAVAKVRSQRQDILVLRGLADETVGAEAQERTSHHGPGSHRQRDERAASSLSSQQLLDRAVVYKRSSASM